MGLGGLSAVIAGLTLLSGDVRFVPELGGVLDKLHIHLNVWITICLDQEEKKTIHVEATNHPAVEISPHVSPYMDFEMSGSVCVPDRFGTLLPPAIMFLFSVLSTSPLDMCLFSGSCGETGKMGIDGGWVLRSSGVLWPLVAMRRPIRGLGGTPGAAVLGFRPIRGLEGTPSLLVPTGGGCLASDGLAWPRRLWRAGLGGVLVATVR